MYFYIYELLFRLAPLIIKTEYSFIMVGARSLGLEAFSVDPDEDLAEKNVAEKVVSELELYLLFLKEAWGF